MRSRIDIRVLPYKMDDLRFGVWLIVMLVQSGDTHSVNTKEEPSCTSRSSYNLLMRTKMVKIENEIRDAVRSLTDHCSNHNAGTFNCCKTSEFTTVFFFFFLFPHTFE